MTTTSFIHLRGSNAAPHLVQGTEYALHHLKRACEYYGLSPETIDTDGSGDTGAIEKSIAAMRKINCFPPAEAFHCPIYDSYADPESALGLVQPSRTPHFQHDNFNIDNLIAGLDTANAYYRDRRIFQLGILTYTTSETLGNVQDAELFLSRDDRQATNTLWLARFTFGGEDGGDYMESFCPFVFRSDVLQRPEQEYMFMKTKDPLILTYCKYVNNTCAEILDGAANSKEITGLLLLRVALQYSNGDLSDKLNKLRVAEGRKERSLNMITKMVTQALRAEAERLCNAYDEERDLFDKTRAEFLLRDVRARPSSVKKKPVKVKEEEENEDDSAAAEKARADSVAAGMLRSGIKMEVPEAEKRSFSITPMVHQGDGPGDGRFRDRFIEEFNRGFL